MRSLVVVAALVSGTGCQELWHLEKVGVAPDAAPDAPPDAPPPTPTCPMGYETIAGGVYRLSTVAVTWQVAAADCAADETAGPPISGHTHLVVLDSTAEAQALYPLGNDRWIGLSDLETTGTFRWIAGDPGALDASSMDAMLWTTGEPNNIGTEHCAHFDSGHMYLVNNVGCTVTPHPYLCECDAYPNDLTTYP